MRIVVTPVIFSPFAIAHWIGAAPRYFGNSEACRFKFPNRRQIDHPLRNDAAVADDNDRFRTDLFQSRAKLGVILDPLRLHDRHSQLQRQLLYGRETQFHAAPARPVGLRDDQVNPMSLLCEYSQSGHCELRCTAENQIHVFDSTPDSLASIPDGDLR